MNFLPGILCVILFTFYIGTILSNRFKLTISQFVILSSVSSLWFSWIVVFFLNKFDILFSEYLIYFLFIIVFLINNITDYKIKINEIIFFFIYFVIFSIIIFSILILDKQYLPVFVHGDAVFQWNGNWAFQLFNNSFKPYGNYPVFWPALWSLIYKSLNSISNWILPSLSLFILPILSINSLYSLFKRKNPITFILSSIFLVIFSFSLSNRYFIGYMDVPLAILSFVFFSITFSFFISSDSKYLIILAFITGVISVTKQAGLIFLLFYFALLVISFFLKLINLRFFFINSFLSGLPFLLFILMYENLNIFSFFIETILGNFGNQSYLKSLSLSHTGEENLYLHSFKKLFERFYIQLFILMLIISLYNFLNLKKRICLLGSMILITAAISFYYFSNFGSYDDRNGWFIIPMIFFSFLCVIENSNIKFFDNNLIKKNFMNVNIQINRMFFFLLIILIFIFLLIEKKINFKSVQKLVQSNFAGTYNEGIIAENFLKENIGCSRVITNWHVFAYNYFVFPYYNLDNTKSRIIVLSSEADYTQFLEQITQCKNKNLFVFNNEYLKTDLSKLTKYKVIILSNQSILVEEIN